MSKKFKDKRCVYCNRTPLETGSLHTADHIVARKLGLPNDRDNYPKAPACKKCNSEKSNLENDLLAVLPFGGRHQDARINLETMVPQRLQKNARVARFIGNSPSISWSEEIPGIILPCPSVNIDINKYKEWAALITKGLMWHHFKTYLKVDEHFIDVDFPRENERIFRKAEIKQLSNFVENTLGNQVFFYQGIQIPTDPEFSIWEFKVYGGLKIMFDSKSGNYSDQIQVITGSNEMIKTKSFSSLIRI